MRILFTTLFVISFFTATNAQRNSWRLTGNYGTDALKDFIGTKDSTSLIFRVDSMPAGQIDIGSYNLRLGLLSAPWKVDSAVTSCNTVFGAAALNYNRSAESINYNVAVGFQSLEGLTSGADNIAVGANSLVRAKKATDNTAVGSSSLYNLKYAKYNSAFGANSLYHDSTGSCNTAVGNQSLDRDSTGNYNTAVGNFALLNNKTGSTLTGMGSSTDVSADGLSNSTAIGYGALITASNQVVLGNSDVTSVVSTGQWSTVADNRFYLNRQVYTGSAMAFIMQLNPVLYRLDTNSLGNYASTGKINQPGNNTNSSTQLYLGLSAQNVDSALTNLGNVSNIVTPATGNQSVYSLSYAQLVVPVIKAMQEQQAQIDDLTKDNRYLMAQLKEMQEAITALKHLNKVK